MANKKALVKGSDKSATQTDPVFPYTNKPNSLRKFLQDVPKKPRPSKIDKTLMHSWGFKDTNDMSILRVLKGIGLLSGSNEPTDLYTRFMNINGGAAELAQPMRTLYAPLFTATHTPYKESADSLRNLFNIHSGGSPTTLELQIQTFKALAESTNFDANPMGGSDISSSKPREGITSGNERFSPPAVHINLHIHLPENKTRRDYETIIEDIGRYIFGRATGDNNDD